jgi:hypothetical protein
VAQWLLGVCLYYYCFSGVGWVGDGLLDCRWSSSRAGEQESSRVAVEGIGVYHGMAWHSMAWLSVA